MRDRGGDERGVGGGSCVKEEVAVQQGSAACAVRSKALSTVVGAALHTKGTTGVVEN